MYCLVLIAVLFKIASSFKVRLLFASLQLDFLYLFALNDLLFVSKKLRLTELV